MIRRLALAFGIANTLAAFGGFVPGVTQAIPVGSPDLAISVSYGLLVGLFPINAVHNLIHLAFGVGGIWAFRSHFGAVRYWQVVGGILVLLSILGAIPATETLAGLIPLYGHDVWLHGLEAVLAVGLWFFGRPGGGPGAG